MKELLESKEKLIELLQEEFGTEGYSKLLDELNKENDAINEQLFSIRSESLCLFLKACGISDQKAQRFVECVLFNEELMKAFNMIFLCLKMTGGIHVYPQSMDSALFRAILFAGVDSVFFGLLRGILGPNRKFFETDGRNTSEINKEQAEVVFDLSIIFNGIIFGKQMINTQDVDKAQYAEDMPGKDVPEIHLHEYISSKAEILHSYFADAA